MIKAAICEDSELDMDMLKEIIGLLLADRGLAYYIFRVVYPDEVTLSMLPLHLKLQESLQRSILAVIMRHFILCMTIRTISMRTLYLTA